jgi:hypothetical protein
LSLGRKQLYNCHQTIIIKYLLFLLPRSYLQITALLNEEVQKLPTIPHPSEAITVLGISPKQVEALSSKQCPSLF